MPSLTRRLGSRDAITCRRRGNSGPLLADQLAVAPEAFTIGIHFAMSSRISFENAGGDIGEASSNPCDAKFSFTSGRPRMPFISLFKRATIWDGVPAGAMKPNQVLTS